LDICLFRVYENGKPAKIQHYLKWSAAGAKENELVFVSGHPGRTSRLFTVAELEYVRDRRLPYALDRLHGLEVLLTAYSARTDENARRARDELFGFQNSRKLFDGELAGILDPSLMARKKAAEQKLRDAVAARPELKDTLAAWDRIAEAQKIIAGQALKYNLLEAGHGFNSTLFGIARTLLRAAQERPKPNSDRLREFAEAGLQSLELQLFSEEPIYEDFEQLRLADSLTWLAGHLGYTDELVQRILAGKSPRQRASELVRGTKVKDVALRKKLYQEGQAAVDAAHDPMIELAKMIDPEARAVRKILETQSEIKQQAHSLIEKARFAIEGTGNYPDATFTLRLAYGTVKGYEEGGQHIPFQTTLAGLYERGAEHKNQPPFDIPARWLQRKGKLDLKTPFNFVSTADIIGGNSGSPVINRQAEFVGIIFDGNLQSLVLDFAFTDEQARAVSVCSTAIIEALRKVYDTRDLSEELLTGKMKRK
jgi:hypothetical protein